MEGVDKRERERKRVDRRERKRVDGKERENEGEKMKKWSFLASLHNWPHKVPNQVFLFLPACFFSYLPVYFLPFFSHFIRIRLIQSLLFSYYLSSTHLLLFVFPTLDCFSSSSS